MSKIKIEMTISVTYTIDQSSYPEGITPEECLKMDEDSFRDDPEALLMFKDYKVKGRIVDIYA